MGLGAVVGEMVSNLLRPLRPEQLVRVTVDNNTSSSSGGGAGGGGGDPAATVVVDVNALIGRSAHICYLENAVAARILIATVEPFFREHLL